MKKIKYMTLDELAGRRVILKCKITIGSFTAKKGTKGTILGGYGRPHVKLDECPCCGVIVVFNAESKKNLAFYVDLLIKDDQNEKDLHT